MDEVTRAKNKFRMDQWAELIRQCQASGMKVNDWCAANGVTHDAYKKGSSFLIVTAPCYLALT